MQIFLAYLKFFYYLCSEIQKLIKMKKILFIIMAALTMVGCNGNEPQKQEATIRYVNPTRYNRQVILKDAKDNVVFDEYVMKYSERETKVAPGKYISKVVAPSIFYGNQFDTINIKSNEEKKIIIEEL